MDNNSGHNEQKSPNSGSKFNFYWIWGFVFIVVLAYVLTKPTNIDNKISPSTFFENYAPKGYIEKIVVVNDQVVEVYIKEDSIKKLDVFKKLRNQGGFMSEMGPHYRFEISSVDRFDERLEGIKSKLSPKLKDELVYSREKRGSFKSVLGLFAPFVLLLLIWFFMMRRVGGGGPGGQIFNIGKSKASLYDKDTKVNITFEDVAGLDEAKEEVKEVVDFLKNPKKYTALGGKIPKGVLLVGPPGTGKTLLAKATAGEAQVPFFSMSGSDFVEMFVGVGASRVRDLFKQAREKAPCIIFIDEIDAVGRARGKGFFQSNDERENTLNQLLVEMDGFSGDKGVIILAATNRPDVLDSALLRPGRFDRQISIDKPDLVGRAQIFKVHLKPLKIDGDVTPEKLADLTPGFAGAEIANVCNEAALFAARKEKTAIGIKDFHDAIDRVIGGLEKKNKIISPQEKEIIAYHEAGHAICGWYLENAHPLLKVTIIPRGVAALGYAQYIPKEQYIYRTEQLLDDMCMTLGGRAAEELVFGKISTGAQNDLQKVTQLAYAMVTVYGMNEKVGNVSFYDPSAENSFTKPYSDETALLIDEEVRKMIEKSYKRTKELLTDKREQLEALAKALLEREILFKADLEALIGPMAHEEKLAE